MSAQTRAVLWMLGGVLSFSMMAISGRELSSELSTSQILFVRSVVGFSIMVLVMSCVGWGQLKTKHLRMHVLRNIVHFLGQYAWFYGIALISLVEVFALEFTMPFWTAILAVIMLGERISPKRMLAIGIGFVGVLIMLRPGLEIISPVSMVVLGAAFLYAFAHTLTKKLLVFDTPIACVFYMAGIQLVIALIFCLQEFDWPSLSLLPWTIGVAVFALTANYSLSRAFTLSDVSVVMPFDYLRLPFITLIGYIFYDERPEIWVLLGGSIVILGSWLNLKFDKETS
ncbi:MAG: DMT family transporter [Proteobacteria bacterium]|nr:DMT family transporter [Pseudomonadota bacterium]MDA1330952.1 DMT family transporter [Pseudomonadota bacterium]